jgi:hypothetical protein
MLISGLTVVRTWRTEIRLDLKRRRLHLSGSFGNIQSLLVTLLPKPRSFSSTHIPTSLFHHKHSRFHYAPLHPCQQNRGAASPAAARHMYTPLATHVCTVQQLAAESTKKITGLWPSRLGPNIWKIRAWVATGVWHCLACWHMVCRM